MTDFPTMEKKATIKLLKDIEGFAPKLPQAIQSLLLRKSQPMAVCPILGSEILKRFALNFNKVKSESSSKNVLSHKSSLSYFANQAKLTGYNASSA